VRNQDAARYARWAAVAAGLTALLVVGIYAARAIRAARKQDVPARIAASVQRQMQTFSYNGMEGNRTVFTIRASRATQFKAGEAALLEDVWISIYGRDGDRNDSIHTRECSYQQQTGAIQCKGEVTIDVRAAADAGTPGGQNSVHITTSNLTFDGQTGEASTPAPVQFSLPEGRGHGVGVSYSTRAAIVQVEHAVEFDMEASPRTGGLPVNIQAGSLEVRRNDRVVLLSGPVAVHEGDRQLSAGNVSISLDDKFRASEVLAQGHPSIRISHQGDTFQASADALDADLSPTGGIKRIAARGNVAGSRLNPQGSSHFSSDRVEFSLDPAGNILRQMTAAGSVAVKSERGGVSQTLTTTALRLNFAPGKQADQQRIDEAETLGPANIVLKSPTDTTDLRAPKFTARLNDSNRLSGLVGRDVTIHRVSANAAPQISTAGRLSASFGADGQWSTVDETGGISFQEGDRRASAQQAQIDRNSGEAKLDGSPVISDSLTRTTATTITLGQKSGEFVAEGGIISTYLPATEGTRGNSTAQVIHITAARLSGSTTTGRAVYLGGARLWQGQSVLQANQIAISRDQKDLQATGNVAAVFPQTSAPSVMPVSSKKTQGPNLWEIRAPVLSYSNQENQVHAQGGVRIVSGEISLTSRALDVDLEPRTHSGAAPSPFSSGQLNRVLAQGDVVVRQGLLRASADRAIYTAADGKFILSGGQPTITDASGNSTSGRSLTFFLPNDTILIDSQEGSRTLTRHRVEK
jgi:lipopolysaccharide export system protein LptA